MTTPIHAITSRPTADGVLHVCLSGDFDMSVAAELSDTLVRAAREPGVRHVLVDLERTTFLDSHGIAGLLAGFDAAAGMGRGFTVTNAHGMVGQVLRITGLAEVFIDAGERDTLS